jgi:hypothetical protein
MAASASLWAVMSIIIMAPLGDRLSSPRRPTFGEDIRGR